MMPNNMMQQQPGGGRQNAAAAAAAAAQYQQVQQAQQQQAYEQAQAQAQAQYEQQQAAAAAAQQQYESAQQHYEQTSNGGGSGAVATYAHMPTQYDQATVAASANGQAPFEPTAMQSFDQTYTPAGMDAAAAADDFALHAMPAEAAKPAKRKGTFRPEHAIKYGLKVVSNTTPVTKVQCLFCVHYGREVSADDTKRKMNVKGIKYWTPPFRTDHYAMHHDLQHKVMFHHYESSSAAERMHFFEPDTVHRLRPMVPKPAGLLASGGGAASSPSAKGKMTKRAKTASGGRVDPAPPRTSLDPFKMMLPPTEIPHDMQTLVDIYVGHNYTPLEEKWKALTTIASLVAQHVRNGFLETHIRRAMLSGASKSEIVQVIMQSASFIGLPKTMDAMKVAHDVFLQGVPDAQNQNTVFL
ncbi:Aste57867_8175 [Aphanomyces stellatus]|uniref:Aste57867_8175 protein n=1 Tax=Aphanomyces stellatus TaxID=120398 RepID=A0A485KJK0_9STRA|nr:hypothetical protein As57867_008145 [Aphanomyces stellatus]VFT85063.1 Aste57867_8175 [Aphanomyces stellatus]